MPKHSEHTDRLVNVLQVGEQADLSSPSCPLPITVPPSRDFILVYLFWHRINTQNEEAVWGPKWGNYEIVNSPFSIKSHLNEKVFKNMYKKSHKVKSFFLWPTAVFYYCDQLYKRIQLTPRKV